MRLVRILATTLAILCSVTAAAWARQFQTVEVESLRISIDADWGPSLAPGYFPARFEITNSGPERTIEIVGHGSRMFRGSGYRTMGMAGAGPTTVRQSIHLAAGDRVRLTMPVPIYADSEYISFEIRERSRLLQRFNPTGFQGRIAAKAASALIVAAQGSAMARVTLRSAGPPTRAAGGRGSVASTFLMYSVPYGTPGRPLDFQLEPARLPTNWLGYTSLRAVALGPTEWTLLNDVQKSALLAWTASGGDLFVVDGDVRSLLPGSQAITTTGDGRVTAAHLFGRVHAVPLSAIEAALTPVLTATDAERDSNLTLPVNGAPDWGVVEKTGFRLKIPGVEGVPARAYLGILLLFAIVIGPLNYWLLRRRGRQVLVVLTAPLISAGFIVLLAGYSIAGEGFRVLGRVVSVTLLDQQTKQAVTRSTVSLYAAGLTPAGGLQFGRDVGVWAVGLDGSGVRDRMEMDLTENQTFSEGVLQARSATNFEQVSYRTARERLTFTPDNGGVSVTNGLDAPLLALYYRNGDTVYALDDRLASGAKQQLTASPAGIPRGFPTGVVVPPKYFVLLQRQPPGSYLAVLDQSPFWEPGVARVGERGSTHLVIGWPEGQR